MRCTCMLIIEFLCLSLTSSFCYTVPLPGFLELWYSDGYVEKSLTRPPPLSIVAQKKWKVQTRNFRPKNKRRSCWSLETFDASYLTLNAGASISILPKCSNSSGFRIGNSSQYCACIWANYIDPKPPVGRHKLWI